jgi:hypothetical protein
LNEQEIMAVFSAGRCANERDEPQDDNPYTAGSMEHAAWEAGWLEEEGPTYTVTARAAADYRGATLGDVWPAL